MPMNMINTSVSKALVGLVVVALIAGAILGIGYADTELFNRAGATAEAQARAWEAEIEVSRDRIDLQYYELERGIESEERIKQLRQETASQYALQVQAQEHQQQRHELQMRLLPILYGAAGIGILFVGIGLVRYLSALARGIPPAADPKEVTDLRERLRNAAKENERLKRQVALQDQKQQGTIDGNGYLQPMKLITPNVN
jgi:NAD(P)-dependent dehydrogenase (short-subunit alcohol dehydrogenase family)